MIFKNVENIFIIYTLNNFKNDVAHLGLKIQHFPDFPKKIGQNFRRPKFFYPTYYLIFH